MYGTATGVAALARVWTRNGAFYDADAYDEATIPSLAQVETWLETVSNALDVALANEGFVTPVTVASVVSAMSLMVESLVADLCQAEHQAGRFFTEQSLERGTSPMWMVRKELVGWVAENATGLENKGVPRISDAQGAHLAQFDLM